jgi:hypothetical protein
MRIAAVPAVMLLLIAPALGQGRNSDPDVPVLKRRPPVADHSAQKGSQSENMPQPLPPPPETLPPSAPQVPPPEPPSRGGQTASINEPLRGQDAVRRGELSCQFLQTRSGGVVRVTVNDPDDTDAVGEISVRLRETASRFTRGDFSPRQWLSGENAPGVAVMRQLRSKIIYTAHGIDSGAELIISSQDQKAVDAIHQFLQFQKSTVGQ